MYKKYKKIKLQWFAEIPETWILSSFKNYLHKVYGGGTPSTSISENWGEDDDPNCIPWVAISDITKSNGVLYETSKKITEKGRLEKGLEILPKGTLLMSIFASLGKTTRLGIDATINQAILGLVPSSNLKLDFLEYLLIDAERYVSYYSSASTQENLNLTKIKNLQFPIPSLQEQTQIARFLDHQTGVIDDLIKQKEKLIELLKEKRQAVINEAVTKGLDPKAKMKDSGIDWLGEIPKNWYVTRFNRGIELLTDYEANGSFDSIKKNVEFTDEEGFAWYVRATDLENNNIADVDKVRWVNEATYNFLSKTKLIGKELLIAKRGEIGKVYLMPETKYTATLAPNLYLVRLNERLNPNFTWFYFESYLGKNQLVLKNRSVTIGAIYKDDLKEIDMIFPPIEEQLQIVKYLNNACKDIEVISTSILTQIEKLKEYRQSLISEAVTGKIDVRDWQPKKQAVA